MKSLPCLFLYMACALPVLGQPVEKVLYDHGEFAEHWQVSHEGNVTWKHVPEGIEFTIHALQPGDDQLWPRLVLQGPAVDVSDYSRLVVKVENAESKQNSITVGALSAREEVVGLASQIEPGKAGDVILDITGNVETLEVSSLNEIHIYQYKPIEDLSFTLRKVAAVANPDYVSKRTALKAQAEEVERSFNSLEKAMGGQDDYQERLAVIRDWINESWAHFENREPGYARKMDDLLRQTSVAISRVAIQSRTRNLTVWQTPLGVPIRQGMLPMPQDPELTSIDERVCLNQYKATTINLSTAAQPADIQINLRVKEGSGISLRQALWVKARDQSYTADALSAAAETATLKMEPFSTEQVILWVDAKRKAARPGVVEGNVELSFSGGEKQSIPFRIETVDVRLPDHAPLHLSNWAYFYIGSVASTRGLEEAIRDNLRDYGMTAWNLDYIQVPLPEVDEAGKFVGLEPESEAAFRKVIDFLKGVPEEEFVVWLGFQRDDVVAKFEKEGVLEGYLSKISAILDEYGIGKDKRLLMFWDEPKLPEIRETVKWMQRVRKSHPEFKLYDNGSAVPSDDAEIQAYTKETDIWFPNWDQLFVSRPEAAQRALANRSRRMGFYRCLMSRNNGGVNIYEYYRLMAWYLMQHRFDTLAFWVHNVGAEDPWDGTTGTGSGGMVVYPKDGQLLLSRRWELFRETIDDYRLAGVAFGETGVIDMERYPSLKKLVEEVIARPDSPGTADEARGKLIDLALKRNSSTP